MKDLYKKNFVFAGRRVRIGEELVVMTTNVGIVILYTKMKICCLKLYINWFSIKKKTTKKYIFTIFGSLRKVFLENSDLFSHGYNHDIGNDKVSVIL